MEHQQQHQHLVWQGHLWRSRCIASLSPALSAAAPALYPAQPSRDRDPATSGDAKGWRLALVSELPSFSAQLRWLARLLRGGHVLRWLALLLRGGHVVVGGGRRRDRTGEGGTGSSPINSKMRRSNGDSLLKICNSPGGSPRKGGRPALGSNLWRGRGRAEDQRATRFEAGRRDTAGCEAQERHVRVQERSCGEQLWDRLLGAGRSRSGGGRSPQRGVGRTRGSLSRGVPWGGGEGHCLLDEEDL